MFKKPLAIRRQLCCAVAALLFAATLSACTSAPGKRGSGNQEDGYTFAGVFCVCFAGPYIAWKKGFFKDEGVPVRDFVMTAGGSDTFAALAGGDADFGLSGLDAIMRGRESGVDVRSVATISPEFYSLAIRSNLSGEVDDMSDLEGKKVSVSKAGSASWAFLKLLLEEAGMGENDVEIVPLGGIDTTMAGLKSGKVDAAVVWEPGTAEGAAEGYADILLSALDPADHDEIYGTDKSISMTLGVTEAFLEDEPEVIEGAVAALDRADRWMQEHSAEEIATVLTPLAEGLDKKTLVSAVENTMKTMPDSAAVSKQAYRVSAGLLQDAGIVEEVPPVEEVFDCEVGECVR